MQSQKSQLCQLCQREMAELTVHHLIPRQTVKRKQADAGEKIDICSACHRQIHSFYSNLQLARELNTVEQLQNDLLIHCSLLVVRC
jgi:hypothetical protein